MAESRKQLPQNAAALPSGSALPRLGDLVLDHAAGHRVGVVIGLPDQTVKTYHLRTPGGGKDWRAKGDGSSLSLLHAPVTHATPRVGEVQVEGATGRLMLPLTLHHVDGGTSESVLLVTAGRTEQPVSASSAGAETAR